MDDPGRSPFALALVLRLLLLTPSLPGELIDTTLRRLLTTQHADGSWTASALLAIPNSCGREVAAPDNRRIFTTATVLRTLLPLQPAGSKEAL